MTVFLALVKREFQEHRGAFVWFPAGVAAFALMVMLLSLGVSVKGDLQFDNDETRETVRITLEESMTVFHAIQYGLQKFSDAPASEQRNFLDQTRNGIAGVFQAILIIVLFFYLVGTIYEERSDRSVYFWKSMPISDLQCVSAKLTMALVVGPALYLAAIAITQLAILVVVTPIAWSADVSAWDIWWDFGLLYGWLHSILGYVVYAFWVLPIYAWLLLVSSTAPRLPVVLAIAVPLAPIVVEGVLFRTDHISSWIGAHITGQPLAGVAASISDSLSLFARADLYIGAAIGAAMLAGTVYYRRLLNET